MTARRLLASILPSLERPIFIIGAARSGTTFLGDCLGRLPEVTYHHEPPATKAAGRYVYEGLWGFRRSRWFFRLVYALARAGGAGRGPALRREDAHEHLPHPVPGSRLPGRAVHPHHPRRPRRGLLAHAQALAPRPRTPGPGEREPGGYLHGPWPKFWVEPDAARRVRAHERRSPHGLGVAPLHGGGAARWRGPRVRRATTSCATRSSSAARSTRANASSTSWASARQRSRDGFLAAVAASRRLVGGHLAEHVLPLGAGRDRGRGRRPAATARLRRLGRTGRPDASAEPRDLGFLHLGRPESGVRRYGQLIAAEARQRSGLAVLEVDAGRLDEDAGQLAEVAAELAGTQVVIMQWNRRGWGTRGRSLVRLATLPARLAGRARRDPARHLRAAGSPGALACSRRPGACATSVGRPTASSSTPRSRSSACAASCRSHACASYRTSSSVGSRP